MGGTCPVLPLFQLVSACSLPFPSPESEICCPYPSPTAQSEVCSAHYSEGTLRKGCKPQFGGIQSHQGDTPLDVSVGLGGHFQRGLTEAG